MVDRTGKSTVRIQVGSQGNGGAFGFSPAAVKVSPGTEVVWEWVDGMHNDEAEDGSFKSELVGETGHTFAHTFAMTGTTKYFCLLHKAMGMKGVIVVE
ncbi:MULTISPECIES: halocyanin domain-containing protein [Halorussus]|uniref:halocyanin domain-containing protein n=1 Tax=Halorussus TaxID=1070314 RepID=UPI00209D1A29|nr:halocyanin domain-containing protein [Halorussus vallis]USZ78427.1 halocyanin domain-containing protein [Halorussus vallis]